jgi:hypothetical protein
MCLYEATKYSLYIILAVLKLLLCRSGVLDNLSRYPDRTIVHETLPANCRAPRFASEFSDADPAGGPFAFVDLRIFS